MLTSKLQRTGLYAQVVKNHSSKLWVQQLDTSRAPSLNQFLEDAWRFQATMSIPSVKASPSSVDTL